MEGVLLSNATKQRLVTKSWAPPKVDVDGKKEKEAPFPVGIIVFCHGYCHRVTDDEQYDYTGDFFARQGYAVHGLDHIGHGKSPGKPAFIPSFDYLVDDMLTYAQQLRAMYGDALTERRRRLTDALTTAQEEAERARADLESKTGEVGLASETDVDPRMHPAAVELASLPVSGADIPFFLMGESMGGAVAIVTAASGKFAFDGVLLVAPMCAIDPKMVPPKCVVSTLTCMQRCCPAAPLVPGPRLIDRVFKDQDKHKRVLADPRAYLGKIRLATGLHLMNATLAIQASVSSYSFPFIVFHGTADQATSPEQSRVLFESAASKDKTLVMYGGAYHALFWEPETARRVYFTDMLSWIQRRVVARKTGAIIECNDRIDRSPEFLQAPQESGAGDAPLSPTVARI